jgi:rod shape determining protein RodA
VADKKKRLNWPLFGVLAAILVLSILFIQSASYNSSTGSYNSYAKKQVIWFALGFAVFLAMLPVKTRRFKQWAPVMYAVVLLTLASVFVLGESHKGARRWIPLGLMNFQPSELMKLAVILAVARYMSGRDMREKWTRMLVPLAIVLVPVAMILKQPDLGTAIVFLPVVLAMLWTAGVKKRCIAAIIGVLIIILPIGWCFVLKDYQKGRLLVFLDPENPKRVMKKFIPPERLSRMKKVDGYHLVQSKIAVGSGGLLGKGWGRGTQNTLGYLPEPHTDFIFGVVAEEWGFVGSTLIIILFFILLMIGFETAADTPDPFGRYVSVGVVTLIFVHVAINTGMTVGLAPITGLTLPFLSYGGSSVVTFFMAIGLLANVHRHRVIKLASE